MSSEEGSSNNMSSLDWLLDIDDEGNFIYPLPANFLSLQQSPYRDVSESSSTFNAHQTNVNVPHTIGAYNNMMAPNNTLLDANHNFDVANTDNAQWCIRNHLSIRALGDHRRLSPMHHQPHHHHLSRKIKPGNRPSTKALADHHRLSPLHSQPQHPPLLCPSTPLSLVLRPRLLPSTQALDSPPDSTLNIDPENHCSATTGPMVLVAPHHNICSQRLNHHQGQCRMSRIRHFLRPHRLRSST